METEKKIYIRSDDFKTTTSIYDTLIDHINDIAKQPLKIIELKKIMSEITDKNSNILLTNIVGYQLLFNDRDQSRIFDVLGLKKDDVKNICLNSSRLDGIGEGINQFVFAVPLLLLSGALANLHKDKESKEIFLFTFYKPYASKVAAIFKYEPDEAAMEYTVQEALDNKSFIHKYGSVLNVLSASAASAYAAFIDDLQAKTKKPTDDLLYNNLFYSAIFSKTGSWLKSVCDTYLKVKKQNLTLKYEKSHYASIDSDSGDEVYEENGIGSNSALKREIVQKAITKFNMEPINIRIINYAVRLTLGETSAKHEKILRSTLEVVSESKSDLIPRYIDAIVGAYLDSNDDTGAKNTAKEIKSMKFLANSQRIFKVSHTDNVNIREEQNLTENILTDCCPSYVVSEIKTKRKIKTALYYYFVYFIQQAA